jgi:hypothetical protein
MLSEETSRHERSQRDAVRHGMALMMMLMLMLMVASPKAAAAT